MGEKLLAGLMASLVAVPLCLLCVAGPAIFAAIGTWITIYITEIGVPLVAFLIPIGIFVLWRLLRHDEKARHGRRKEPLL